MPAIPAATIEHYRRLQHLQVLALAASRRAWRGVSEADIAASWRAAVGPLVAIVDGVQYRAAESALSATPFTLAQQGSWVAPDEFLDPAAFAGVSSLGASLDAALYSPAPHALRAIADGATAKQALATGRDYLEQLVRTAVTDAGRDAASADIASRVGVGYVRMVNPPSCSRCAVLAGRFYRWNAGFDRHPNCDCVHVPSAVTSRAEAHAHGLIDDPYEAFHAMTEAEQDKTFGIASAQAIRDGADISQVVNAKRGMSKSGRFTTEGTSKRGHAASVMPGGYRRLTPNEIYRRANGNRERAVEMLRQYGYVLPQGQVVAPLRANLDDYLKGRNTGKAQAVAEALRTGQVDPHNIYAMTEKQRAAEIARLRYDVAKAGYDPYVSPGFGNRPMKYGEWIGWDATGARRAATPTIQARAEADYRAALAAVAGDVRTTTGATGTAAAVARWPH